MPSLEQTSDKGYCHFLCKCHQMVEQSTRASTKDGRSEQQSQKHPVGLERTTKVSKTNPMCAPQASPGSRRPPWHRYGEFAAIFCFRCTATALAHASPCVFVCSQMIESDFYSTQAGRDHFRDQLQSIRYCVQEVRLCCRAARARAACIAFSPPSVCRRRATSTLSVCVRRFNRKPSCRCPMPPCY